MKTTLTLIFMLISFNSIGSQECPTPWRNSSGNFGCEKREMSIRTWGVKSALRPYTIKEVIRSGYIEENSAEKFKGNIIFYQGLGDSMLNHLPLFSKLSNLGYRIIAFDYMGQGGSSGTMNNTRIYEIANIGDTIWNMYARELDKYPKKTVIGWSTGGLAAYAQSIFKKNVDNLILLAPGIAPRKLVGEQKFKEFKFNQITLKSLTTAKYSNLNNPHIDPIKPSSPLVIPSFSIDLVTVAEFTSHFNLPSNVKGFVLLSGDKDTYVNPKKTRRIIKKRSPHFKIKQYKETLHELDNESDFIRDTIHQDIVDFLNLQDEK